MVYLATLLLFLSLAAVIYQDFKDREVSLLAFVGVLLSLGYITYPNNVTYWMLNSGVNILFIVLQLFTSFAIISIRKKKITNIVNTHIGLGDVLMLLILAITFSAPVFLLVTLVSCITALLQALVMRIVKGGNGTIPLAGVMALVLVGMLGLKYLFQINDLYDADSIGMIIGGWNV